MLTFEVAYSFENSCPPFEVTFFTEGEKEKYCKVAKFHFNNEAFNSVEAALSLFTSLVGNNLCLKTSFGYMIAHSHENVYYGDITGVTGFAEIKTHDDLFDEYFNVSLYYPSSISTDEIHHLIDEILDIKSFKLNIKQVFDY